VVFLVTIQAIKWTFLEPSPNPSLGIASVTEAAPRKMFKQRYLANEQTNQVNRKEKSENI